MDSGTVFLSIATAFAVFCLLVIAAAVVWAGLKYYKALSLVADKLTRLTEQMTGIPVILEGITAICRTLSTSTVQMSSSVDKFSAGVLGPTSGPRRTDKSAFTEFDEAQADREYHIRELMEAQPHLSFEMARDAVVAGVDEQRFIVHDQ